MRINAGTLASLLETDLQQAGWNGTKSSYPDQTLRQFALTSLAKSLTKKYLLDARGTTTATDVKALDLFLEINEKCRTFQFGTAGLPSWTRVALGEAQAFLYRFFYPVNADPDLSWGEHETDLLTLGSIAQGFGVGPGSSLGAPETDFYSKFCLSDMSASSSVLHDLYVQAIRANETWTSMEMLRSSVFGRSIAESSRLSFVPKTAEISRTICTEPVLNMIFQKGIASVLERRLRQVTGIDLRLQPDRNRRLAREGSVTGEFGTIDLSSASDSLSLSTVENFFPASVVRWLKRCSCRSTVLPDGRKIELHMISSMGNAFTFPLQTIFFVSLVYGAYRSLGLRVKFPRKLTDGNLAVFGDDIIVHKEAYSFVCELLDVTGFTVNRDKSFNDGLFRESCGHDYYHGCDVRGVYIKKLSDVSDCYSAINRLNRWSAVHDVPLTNLVGYLRSKCRYLPIPFDEDDASGIKVPLCFLKEKNPIHKDTGGHIYRCLVNRARSYSVGLPFNERKVGSSSAKPRGFMENNDGLLISLLAGSIRDGRIGLRSLSNKPVVKRRYSSRWDYIPSGWREIAGFDVRWKAYVELNAYKA